MIDVVAAAPEHAAAILSLFEEEGSPCFCRFWHFTGDNNAWLDRCANQRDDNKNELTAAIASGSDEARAVIAVVRAGDDAGRVVGWLKVAPREVMGKLYQRRHYKNLPCLQGDRPGTWVIGCALVHPRWRHRGITTNMVRGAIPLARAWGARSLEAFPRRPKEPVADEELWTGPVGAFAKNGFYEADTFEPYPVLRLDLGG